MLLGAPWWVGQGIDPLVRADRIGHPRDIPNYRPSVSSLVLDVMADQVVPGFRQEFDRGTNEKRRVLLDQFPPVDPLYLCSQPHPILTTLQGILGGTLYFRRAQAGGQALFEFLLMYEGAGPVPFGQWSAGQKLESQPRQGPEIPDINLIQDVLAELGTNRKLPSQGGSDQMTMRARLDVLRTG